MDVIIRVIATGEVLNLPVKFALEDKITSAFFSSEGSKSIPVTFPITNHNSKIFGYSQRLDRANKSNKEIPVIISKGSYSRKGMLYLNSSYNTESSYGASIAYDEAIMYNLQSELKLTQLPNLPVEESGVETLIKKMQELLTVDNVDEPLTVFQIYLKSQGTYKKKPYENQDIELTYEAPFVLNEWDKLSYDEIKLIVKEKVEILYEDQPLPIPAAKGIGLSPFVHGWYVIEKIAEYFGYRVGENPFRTDPQLRRFTLLNNTADAIVAGFLDYKQLMPDITITEFFQFLWGRFGAKVFIDGNTNTMNIRLLKDSITESGAILLPVSGKYDIDESTPRQLKLSASRNLDLSGTETDTYEEFCRKYNNTIGDFWRDYYVEGVGGVVQNKNRGLFFLAPMSERDWLDQGIKAISSIHFDWDKKVDGSEYVEITSPDECITMAWQGDQGLYPYYGLEFALRNSILEINRDTQQRDEANRLAVCWDMGEYYYDNGHVMQGYKFGSIFPYLPGSGERPYFQDREGNTFKYALTYVGKDGCFEHFWKEYDAILRHSGDTVKGKLNLQPFELSSLDISKKYIMANHPVLLTDYSYVTGNINIEKQEFNAITLGLYEPNDLKEEQAHPLPDPIRYVWKLTDNKVEKIQLMTASRIDYWKKYADETAGVRYLDYIEDEDPDDPNPPTLEGLHYYPPSEKDVELEALRGVSEHTCTSKNKVKLSILDSLEPDGIETRADTQPVNYKGWFEATLRENLDSP